MLSVTTRLGNRHAGSRMILSIPRGPKSRSAWKVRLPPNQTSTGHVTIAVTLSTIVLLGIGLIAGPCGANRTLSTTGDGIWPSCLTVTLVREPAVATRSIEPSTDSVVNSQIGRAHV